MIATSAMRRDARQKLLLEWVQKTFGVADCSRFERARRLLEEAIEVAQAEGLLIEEVTRLADHIYGKPPGEPEKEAGAVGVTLLAYCEAAGFSAEEAEQTELQRVLAMDRAECRRRHAIKAKAGVAPDPTLLVNVFAEPERR